MSFLLSFVVAASRSSADPSHVVKALRPGTVERFPVPKIEDLDLAVGASLRIREDQAGSVRGPVCDRRVLSTIVCGDPPSIPITQIAPAEVVYATCFPSGEMAGEKICPGGNVSCNGSVPSLRLRHNA